MSKEPHPPCANCQGTRLYGGYPCSHCDLDGFKAALVKVVVDGKTVTLPPGVYHMGSIQTDDGNSEGDR